MRAESTLHDIREAVVASRLSHVPTNVCFLFNGHALDPNVEATIKAGSVALVTTPPDTHAASVSAAYPLPRSVVASAAFVYS